MRHMTRSSLTCCSGWKRCVSYKLKSNHRTLFCLFLCCVLSYVLFLFFYCVVLSCLVLLCCVVICCVVSSCVILCCRLLSCGLLCCVVLSGLVWSCGVLCCLVWSCPVISHSCVLSCLMSSSSLSPATTVEKYFFNTNNTSGQGPERSRLGPYYDRLDFPCVLLSRLMLSYVVLCYDFFGLLLGCVVFIFVLCCLVLPRLSPLPLPPLPLRPFSEEPLSWEEAMKLLKQEEETVRFLVLCCVVLS
jgi:hypothetical protein